MEVRMMGIKHIQEFIKKWLMSLDENPLLVDPIKKFILEELQSFAKEKISDLSDISKLTNIKDLANLIEDVKNLDQLELIVSGLIYALASGEMKLTGEVGPITKGIILTSFKKLNEEIWKNIELKDKSLKSVLDYYIKYLVDSGQIDEGDIEIIEVTDNFAKIKIKNDPFAIAIRHITDKLGNVNISDVCLRGLSLVAFFRTITGNVADIEVESFSETECMLSIKLL